MSLPEIVTQKLADLPPKPGVYLFKDKKGDVVYVGKAKSLRARVRSYFQAASADTRYFIPILERSVGDIETIVTQSEKEAQILENSLIKRHHPRYNVKLRDDKEYLSLRLSLKDEWPRLYLVRRPRSDGARYFGPYHSATAARRTLHLVNKHFQLRTCTDPDMASRKRPCLQYQIKRCPAPCVYDVSRAFYDEQVHAVLLFLDGRHDELSRELDDKMREAARQLQFELAVVYRDQLGAIDKVREAQRVVTAETTDRDVIGIYREAELCELAILHVRAGRLFDVSAISLRGVEIPDEELIAGVIAQHYVGPVEETDDDEAPPSDKSASDKSAAIGKPVKDGELAKMAREGETTPLVKDSAKESGKQNAKENAKESVRAAIPSEILVPVLPEASAGLSEYLSELAGHKVVLAEPQRGPRVRLLEMAKEQAKHGFAEKRRAADDVVLRLSQIKEKLRLPSIPRRIECCDISHLGGGDTVGAIVALKDGQPDKKRYRTFNVKTVGAAAGDTGALGDDYGAMYEVLARRFKRGAEKKIAAGVGVAVEAEVGVEAEAEVGVEVDVAVDEPGEWELPDLFVVDGGRGQLAVALAAARDLGLHELPIVALAKEKENVLGETLVDRVYLPGQKNPIPLRSHSSSLFYLARARDEAHRFANFARQRRGKKKRFHSALDDVKGVGPAVKKALLKEIGSVAAILAADDATLLAVPKVNARHVKAIRQQLGRGAARRADHAETDESLSAGVAVASEPGPAPANDKEHGAN